MIARVYLRFLYRMSAWADPEVGMIQYMLVVPHSDDTMLSKQLVNIKTKGSITTATTFI